MSTRRRLMMHSGDKEYDYIKDGLVFWLDADDFDEVFTARVGGQTIKNHGATKVGSLISLASAYLSVNRTIGHSIASTSKNLQAEVVFRGGNGYILDQGSSCVNLQIISNYLAYYKGNGTARQYSVKTTLQTTSVNSSVGYTNGVKIGTTKDNGVVGSRNIINIGGYNNISSWGGRLGCIRIYNRALTEEEILHNQQIDMKRFGIV